MTVILGSLASCALLSRGMHPRETRERASSACTCAQQVWLWLSTANASYLRFDGSVGSTMTWEAPLTITMFWGQFQENLISFWVDEFYVLKKKISVILCIFHTWITPWCLFFFVCVHTEVGICWIEVENGVGNYLLY